MDFEFEDIMKRVRDKIEKIEPNDSVERYKSLGVDVFSEEARVLDPHTVKIGEKSFRTRAIVLATGAEPFVPPIPGLNKTSYLTSDTVWSLKSLPKRLVVIGGGPIGAELSQCFARLGSKVSVFDRGLFLSRLGGRVSSFMKDKFKKEGIDFYLNSQIQTIQNKKLYFKDSLGEMKELEFDEILLALGRKPRVKGLGLEDLKIKTDERGRIKSNSFMQTNHPSIFVCGDVTSPYQFTHMASHQAYYACLNSLTRPYSKILPSFIKKKWFKIELQA